MKRLKDLFVIVSCLMVWVIVVGGWTYTYDTATPAGGDDPREADDRIREVKAALQERFAIDHYFPLTGTEVSHADVGMHQYVTYQAPISTPATIAASQGRDYIKDVGGKAERHWIDEDENELQMTSGGDLYSSTGLRVAGNTALAGTLAVTGAIDPCSFATTSGGFLDEDNMASDAADKVASQQSIKKYVDDAIGQSSQAAGTSNISNSSGNWADMANMSVTITTKGGNTLLVFSASINSSASGGITELRFDVDGSAKHLTRLSGYSTETPVSMQWLQTSLAAGSHTFKVQWKDVAQTAQQNGATWPRIFTVIELPS